MSQNKQLSRRETVTLAAATGAVVSCDGQSFQHDKKTRQYIHQEAMPVDSPARIFA